MFLSLQCLAPHESVAYAYISSIKEAVEWGDGVFVWEREWGGGGGGGGWWGLLSEAHNLIIQSIEQHIYFIVLQISPNSLGSSEALRIEQSCRWDLQNDQPRVLLLPFFKILFIVKNCKNGFSSEHHLSLAFQNDMKMIQTRRGRCLVEMF